MWTTCCSVTESCIALCDTMDCSTSGSSILHRLLELAQTHVHWVSDAVEPFHPLPPCRGPLREIPPMTRSWGEDLTRKAIQDTRDPPGWPWPLPHPVSSPLFCCCSCLPCCRFLCCLRSSPAPLSSNKDQLKTLINKSPRRWYPRKGPGMKKMLQFKPFCWHCGLFDKCVLPLQEISWWLLAVS